MLMILAQALVSVSWANAGVASIRNASTMETPSTTRPRAAPCVEDDDLDWLGLTSPEWVRVNGVRMRYRLLTSGADSAWLHQARARLRGACFEPVPGSVGLLRKVSGATHRTIVLPASGARPGAYIEIDLRERVHKASRVLQVPGMRVLRTLESEARAPGGAPVATQVIGAISARASSAIARVQRAARDAGWQRLAGNEAPAYGHSGALWFARASSLLAVSVATRGHVSIVVLARVENVQGAAHE